MEAGEIVWHVFALIGAVKVACMLIPWLYWKIFCCVNLKNYEYGYVLITGATDGIGKSIAKQFVYRKFKVLLISRSQEKLDKVKSEFLSIDPLATIETIASDFSDSHKNPIEFYNNLSGKIDAFPISILVNNVGIADLRFLDNQNLSDIESMIGVNTYPIVFLTHSLIHTFLSRFRTTKEKSLVINISSSMEESIIPGNAVYSATKRFITFFSEGLRYEYKAVQVVTVKPGAVLTPMLINAKNEGVPLQASSDDYAKALLNGLRTGVNHGHWKHKLLGILFTFPPYLLTVLNTRLILPMMIKKEIIKVA